MGAEAKIPAMAMEQEGASSSSSSEEQLQRREKERKMTGSVLSAIPSSPISLDISLPLPQLKPHVIDLCKDLFGKWSCLESSHFTVEKVSGGITNLLLKVSVKEATGVDVFLTVRLYGPNTDLVIDRKREMQALPHLSAAGFGAELLGLFENDMGNPKIAAEIARQLYKFHQVEVSGPKEPQLWNDLFKFLEKAAVLKFDDDEKQARYETISFTEVRGEVNELEELTDLLHAPLVFSHKDLLSGNLMLNEKDEKLYFIDFEYGSYSYRGYDIANYFNEYAGYECTRIKLHNIISSETTYNLMG